MTGLGIRYLRGCAVSSNHTRQQTEWPPHPGRVFMALAAAHFESQGDEEERAALEWIEQQTASPGVRAAGGNERVTSRGYGTAETYVPVNDQHGGIGGRSRQARSFPTIRLDEENVYLVWKEAAPEPVRTALERLCGKVTRIGHSSSLVQMWVMEPGAEVRVNWQPGADLAEKRMRVAGMGTLALLERAYRNGERPRLTRWEGYRSAAAVETKTFKTGLFDARLIVFEKVAGRVLGLESTLQLTGALRNAAMRAAGPEEAPAWISGHEADGAVTKKPHVAFFPLPFVDAPYADGHVMGLEMAIPYGVPTEEAQRAMGPLLFDTATGEERTIRLWRQDSFWKWQLRREMRDRPPTALRAATWTEPSRRWASVTPVVLHHYPKKKRDEEVERILREAFESAGLPEPKWIETRGAPVFEGAPGIREMPGYTEGGQSLCRYQTHVVAEFDEPVEGPVLVGRGRFRGYGLFRPMRGRP